MTPETSWMNDSWLALRGSSIESFTFRISPTGVFDTKEKKRYYTPISCQSAV